MKYPPVWLFELLGIISDGAIPVGRFTTAFAASAVAFWAWLHTTLAWLASVTCTSLMRSEALDEL
eukprot:gene6045-6118_t